LWVPTKLTNRRKRADGIWEGLPGINRGAAFLAGQSVIDQLQTTLPDGAAMRFVDVHVCDPLTGERSNATRVMGAPPDWTVYPGRFVDGVGAFEKVFTEADGGGRTSGTRGKDHPRTRRACGRRSEEDGVAWEENWVMELTRISDA
jgi:hypothetical protein